VEAANLFGVRQPYVSKMLRGEFRQFSVERLLRFLVALDQDVEIVVKPHRGQNDSAGLQVLQRGIAFRFPTGMVEKVKRPVCSVVFVVVEW